MNALQIAGDGKDKTKVQAAIGAIAGIIHTHPDYSDAYVARATYSLIAGDTDYQQIRSDLDLRGHIKTGQRWSLQNRPTKVGLGLGCFTPPPPVEASLFLCANSVDHI